MASFTKWVACWDIRSSRSPRSLTYRQTDIGIRHKLSTTLLYNPHMEFVRHVYVIIFLCMSERRLNRIIILPGLDLHDHQELRSKFLLFIHDLLQSLRSSGVSFFSYASLPQYFGSHDMCLFCIRCNQISASYSLAPSSSSLCLVCLKPINVDVLQQIQDSRENLKR